MPPTPAEVETQLDAGAWLRPGSVGVLFGVSRFTVDDWITKGKLRYRRTPGGQRECDPADVRRMLDEYRQVHRDGADEV